MSQNIKLVWVGESEKIKKVLCAKIVGMLKNGVIKFG